MQSVFQACQVKRKRTKEYGIRAQDIRKRKRRGEQGRQVNVRLALAVFHSHILVNIYG